MGVVKLSKSNRQVQFITDDGNMYATSVAYLSRLMGGYMNKGFIVLNRMPFNVSSDRFPKSPVYNPANGQATEVKNFNSKDYVKPQDDALAKKNIEEGKRKKVYGNDISDF